MIGLNYRKVVKRKIGNEGIWDVGGLSRAFHEKDDTDCAEKVFKSTTRDMLPKDMGAFKSPETLLSEFGFIEK